MSAFRRHERDRHRGAVLPEPGAELRCDDYAALHRRTRLRSRRRLRVICRPYGNGEVGGAFLPKDDHLRRSVLAHDFDELGLPGEFDPADRWLFPPSSNGTYGAFRTDGRIAPRSATSTISAISAAISRRRARYELQQFGGGRLMCTVACRRAFGCRTFSASTSRCSSRTGVCPSSTSTIVRSCIGPLSWSVASSWASFERSNGQFVGIQRINGDRLDVEPRVRVPFDWTPGFLHLDRRLSIYAVQPRQTCRSASTKIRTGRSGWVRSTADCSSNASPSCSGGGIQTLEPRLFYLYQQYRNQNDLPQFDVSELSLHVRSVVSRQPFRRYRSHRRRQPADGRGDDAVAECRHRHGAVRAPSLGQIYLLRRSARDVERRHHGRRRSHKNSAFAGQIGATLSSRTCSSRTSATWDPNDGQLNEIGSSLQYRPDNRHILNLSYRRRDDCRC